MLNSKNDDAYGLREIYRIQGIKLGYGRAVAIMRPPARINTAPRPNECGRPPESAYLGIRTLFPRHFLPVCTALFPFNCPLTLDEIVNFVKYIRFFAHPILIVVSNSEHP